MNDKCSNVNCDQYQFVTRIITDEISGRKFHVFICSDCAEEFDKAQSKE
jgi:hypothetical protein